MSTHRIAEQLRKRKLPLFVSRLPILIVLGVLTGAAFAAQGQPAEAPPRNREDLPTFVPAASFAGLLSSSPDKMAGPGSTGLSPAILEASRSSVARQEGQAQQDPLVISAEAAESILKARRGKSFDAALSDYSPSFIEKVAKRLEEYLSFQRLHLEQGTVSAEGCMIANATEEEDWFAVRAPGRSTSLDQLVSSADEVLVARILSAEPVLLGAGIFATDHTAEVIDRWNHALEVPSPGKTVHFYRRGFDLTLDGERLCVVREGLRVPKVGETWLLLGRNNSRSEDEASISNFFPIESGIVQHQPYPFLNRSSDGDLERLRRIRLGSARN